MLTFVSLKNPMQLLLLSLLALATQVCAVDRKIWLLSNRTASSVPVLLQLADPEHAKAIQFSRGIYTAANVPQLDQESFQFYAQTFGPELDFTNVAYNPTLFGVGGWPLPKANMFSYIIGVNTTDTANPIYDYVVMDDWDHPLRKSLGGWRNLAVGNLVAVNATIITPVGTLFAGDVLGFADYNLVRLAATNWNLGINREKIRIATPYVSKSYTNQFAPAPVGTSNNQSPLRVIDESGKVGAGVIDTMFMGPDYQATTPLRQYISAGMWW